MSTSLGAKNLDQGLYNGKVHLDHKIDYVIIFCTIFALFSSPEFPDRQADSKSVETAAEFRLSTSLGAKNLDKGLYNGKVHLDHKINKIFIFCTIFAQFSSLEFPDRQADSKSVETAAEFRLSTSLGAKNLDKCLYNGKVHLDHKIDYVIIFCTIFALFSSPEFPDRQANSKSVKITAELCIKKFGIKNVKN